MILMDLLPPPPLLLLLLLLVSSTVGYYDLRVLPRGEIILNTSTLREIDHQDPC